MKMYIRCVILLLVCALVACTDYVADIDKAHSEFVAGFGDNTDNFNTDIKVDSYCTCSLDMSFLSEEYGLYVYDYSKLGNGFVRWYVTQCPAGAALSIVPDFYTDAMSLKDMGDYYELSYTIFGNPSTVGVFMPSIEYYIAGTWAGQIYCPAAYVENNASSLNHSTVTTSTSVSKSASSVSKSSSSKAKSSSSIKSSSSKAGSASSAVGFANIIAKTTDPCGDIWCGPALEIRANLVEYDDGTDTYGYWYNYNDNKQTKDGGPGSSRIEWPVELGNEFADDAVDPVVSTCKGMCGMAVFEGTYEYPFVGIGFNLAGKTQAPVYATDWGGLCVVYKTNGVAPMIELMTLDEAVLTGYNNYRYMLKRVTSGTETIDIEWSKFRQEMGWGEEADLSDVVSRLSAIKVKMADGAGSSGYFNIISIGRYGTCNSK